MIAGPYAATLMGDLGADVVKIEAPAGDDMRRIGQERGGETGSFLGVNRNKRGVVLDLAQERGRDPELPEPAPALERRERRVADAIPTVLHDRDLDGVADRPQHAGDVPDG